MLSEYKELPTVDVVVTQVNSRKVFITGEVANPGEYDLLGPMNVVQLIAKAGGLMPYADKENILVVRGSEVRPDGTPWSFPVNYNDISRQRNLQKNLVWLKPGDMVIVPE